MLFLPCFVKKGGQKTLFFGLKDFYSWKSICIRSSTRHLETWNFIFSWLFFPIKPNPKPPLTSSIPSSKKASSNLPKLISPKNPPTKLGVYPLKAKITQSTTFTTTFTIQPSLNTFSLNTRLAIKMKSPKKSKTNFISLTTTICNTPIL